MEFTFTLAGANFRPKEAKEALSELSIDDEVFLEREPDNAYDSNAVMVIDPDSNLHVGYVEKEVAKVIAPLLDEGKSYKTRILSWPTSLKPYVEVTFGT